MVEVVVPHKDYYHYENLYIDSELQRTQIYIQLPFDSFVYFLLDPILFATHEFLDQAEQFDL